MLAAGKRRLFKLELVALLKLKRPYLSSFLSTIVQYQFVLLQRSGQVYKAKLNGAVVAVKALYSQLMTGNIDELKHEVSDAQAALPGAAAGAVFS